MDSIQSQEFKHTLLWHGIFICLLGFVAGLFLPLYANPRTGLATHLLGITQGIFLAVIGLSYPQLKLPLWVARANVWMLLVSAYVGLIAEFLAAVFGLSRMFLITAMGLPEGIPWLETSTEIAIKGISSFILLSCLIVLFGLRKTQSSSTSLEES
ncbi:hydrogenase [Brasilonema sp. UFV-L1]|uniref:hydrogenase n=1 Tax=Brasilonema sp. UFV-L1 TaxID=2234130 RepID=UPI00145D1705|nr:hydrogenase [Brasilonema sp. UFV-L1]NMG08874.1 hydrogenase [Brasilonema sp. UFV-L1]